MGRALPAEDGAGNQEDRSVKDEHIIPRISAAFFGNEDGDEFRTSARRSGAETQIPAKRRNDTAENGTQQHVVDDCQIGKDVDEHGRYDNHEASVQRKAAADIFKADDDGDDIYDEHDGAVRKIKRKIRVCDVPDEQRQSGKTAGKEISRTDKGFHIECGNDRRNENEHYPPKVRTDAFHVLFNNFMYRLSHRCKHILFSRSWQMKYVLPINLIKRKYIL